MPFRKVQIVENGAQSGPGEIVNLISGRCQARVME
jgi:hypothetical protein